MKRVDLIRNLEQHGCRLLREGASHAIYIDASNRWTSAVPRHREINNYTARNICIDLKVPRPAKQ